MTDSQKETVGVRPNLTYPSKFSRSTSLIFTPAIDGIGIPADNKVFRIATFVET